VTPGAHQVRGMRFIKGDATGLRFWSATPRGLESHPRAHSGLSALHVSPSPANLLTAFQQVGRAGEMVAGRRRHGYLPRLVAL
jgi:hypothetical protein